MGVAFLELGLDQSSANVGNGGKRVLESLFICCEILTKRLSSKEELDY